MIWYIRSFNNEKRKGNCFYLVLCDCQSWICSIFCDWWLDLKFQQRRPNTLVQSILVLTLTFNLKTKCLSTLSLRIDDYLTNSSHIEATSIFLYPMKDKIHVKNCRSQKVENINSLLVQISSENGAPEPDRKHGKPKSLLQWCVRTWHGKGEKTLVEEMVENKNSGNRNMHHKG